MLEIIKLILEIILVLFLFTTAMMDRRKKDNVLISKKNNVNGETMIDDKSSQAISRNSEFKTRRIRNRSLDNNVGLGMALLSFVNLGFTALSPLAKAPLTTGSLASTGLALIGVYMGFNLMRDS